jgi:hypothetical protein
MFYKYTLFNGFGAGVTVSGLPMVSVLAINNATSMPYLKKNININNIAYAAGR